MIRFPRSLRYVRPVLTLLPCLCIAASCHTPTETHPEQVVDQVLKHLFERRWEAAWALITPENQKELLEKHAVLAQASGATPTNSAQEVFLAYGMTVHTLPETTKLSSHPDRSPAKVRVTIDHGPGTTLTVHRDADGKWRVDILSALRPVHP